MGEDIFRPKVLFLCTGNSCRSQMAEGWLNHLKAEKFVAYSAGIENRGIDPLAVKVMADEGVDISRQWSKKLSQLTVIPDFVVTVCASAARNCPQLEAQSKKVHVVFNDPPEMALAANSEAEILNCYRNVRDEIKSFVENIEDYLK